MNRAIWIEIIVLFVLAAGAWWYLGQQKTPAIPTTSDQTSQTGAGTQTPSETHQPVRMPSVTFTSPVGMSSIQEGSTIEVRWTSVDISPSTTLTLHLWDNAGNEVTRLAEDTPNDGHESVLVPLTPPGAHHITATLSKDSPAKIVGQSATFTLTR